MRSTPFRFSVTSDELARHPEAPSHLALQRSVAQLKGTSFRPMPQPHDELCHDIHGDHPFGMYVVKDVAIRGDAGIMCTENGEFLLEQNAALLENEELLRQMVRAATLPSCGDAVTVENLISLVSTCTDCFWHWMMDSLPKVFLAEASGYTGAYLLPAHGAERVGLESMSLLGVAPSRLIVQDSTEYQAHNLYIPTHFSGFNAPFNPIFMCAYRERILSKIPTPSSSFEHIYVPRKPEATNRRVVNHNKVEELAHRHGFMTVYFEDLSLKEQITVASQARTVIAPHGSGLTHTLFMQEGSSIIEFFPHQRRTSCDCYERLAPVVGHSYASLESNRDCGSDIEVDISKLEEVLKKEVPLT